MRQIDANAAKRAALVWGVALVMLLLPHRGIVANSDTFLRQPLVLIIAPLLLAAVSLFMPQRTMRNDACVISADAKRRRRSARGGIVLCSVLLLFLAMVLMAVDGNSPAQGTEYAHRVTIVVGVWIGLLLLGIGMFVRRLRRIVDEHEM